jgi:hypothetical protein
LQSKGGQVIRIIIDEMAALDRIARRPVYDLTLCNLRMQHVMCFTYSAAAARTLGREESQARMDDEMGGLQEHLHYLRTGEEP